MKKLAIVGAGGHGKVIANLAELLCYDNIVFLDDNPLLESCGGWPVIGPTKAATEQDCDVIVAIGNAETRAKLLLQLEQQGVNLPVLVHPAAIVAKSAVIGAGSVVMAGAVVNPDVVLGKGCIVNTCASVDHDCKLGDYVHISVGAHLAGLVTVGTATWIGVGVSVGNDIRIAPDCTIGVGAAVFRDITESGTYVGVPARKIR